MADQDKKKKVDQVRVVEEETASIRIVEEGSGLKDEVVRLDAPKRVRAEKMGTIPSKSLIGGDAQVARITEESSKLFDPEEEWLEEREASERSSVPMGWFALLGMVLLGVVAWVFLQSANSPETGISESESPGSDGPLGKSAELAATKDAEAHFKETEDLVRKFLGAGTIGEQLKYVRHPERVRPLMEKHYEENELETVQFKQISEYRIVHLENHPFLALSVVDVDDKRVVILIEDAEDRQLVDWESFVCYQEISPDDFVEERSNETVMLRAYVSPDHFYAYEFADEEKYLSYNLRFRRSDLFMNAFVERGTELEKQFSKVFPKHYSGTSEPLILEVRFVEGGKAPRSVLVEELVSLRWAFAEDPGKVASGEETQ